MSKENSKNMKYGSDTILLYEKKDKFYLSILHLLLLLYIRKINSNLFLIVFH